MSSMKEWFSIRASLPGMVRVSKMPGHTRKSETTQFIGSGTGKPGERMEESWKSAGPASWP